MNTNNQIKLLEQMTLQEKIGQLTQVSGFLLIGEEGELTGPMEQMGVPVPMHNIAGTVLGSSGASEVREIIESYQAKNRLGIPLIFMCDIIHGYRTIFPIPLGMGASWNADLVKESARVAAKEASLGGVHVTFSPMVDLVRDPRWGRVMESTGEDTFLNSVYAKAFIEGYQGDNLKEDTLRLAACVKHFAGYGAAEAGRDYNTVDFSERRFREEHLPAYEAAIKAGAKLVMTSFNTVDSIPSTGNKWLMKELLRDELGFDGVVISDWGAVKELIVHGVAEDEVKAAQLALEATTDIEMMTFCYYAGVEKLIEEGTLDESFIDEAVLRILQLKADLGLFENPYRGLDEEAEKAYVLSSEPREVSRKLAEESFVLLKNENHVLPLNLEQKIALVGPYSKDMDVMGGWAWRGQADEAVQLKEGLEKVAKVVTAEGVSVSPTGVSKKTNYKEALAIAATSDVIVAAIGEHAKMSAEGKSRASIALPEAQIQFIKDLKALNKPLVVVLFNGRPIDLHGILDQTDALLEVWFPGTETGNAIRNVLFGQVNPSGKTTMSFPYAVGQIPVYYNHFQTGRPPTGEPEEEYVSNFMDIPNAPLVPFGFGLSYTTFDYSELVISSESFSEINPLTISTTVTNTGERTGKEVVQFYIRDLFGQVVRPVKELKGFEKITLTPGESKKVSFTLDKEAITYLGIGSKPVLENGEIEVHIGRSSQDTQSRRVHFKIEGEKND